jgi:hypothetical protein
MDPLRLLRYFTVLPRPLFLCPVGGLPLGVGPGVVNPRRILSTCGSDMLLSREDFSATYPSKTPLTQGIRIPMNNTMYSGKPICTFHKKVVHSSWLAFESWCRHEFLCAFRVDVVSSYVLYDDRRSMLFNAFECES